MRPALLALLAACLLACTSARPLASQCSLNSDCAAPLVCAFGACRQPCVTARDCPSGALCVTGSSGNVCQLQSEQRCTATSCPGGLSCAMGTCTSACTSDDGCAGGLRCVASACVECSDTSECARGLVCERGRCVPDAADAEVPIVDAGSRADGAAPTRRPCGVDANCDPSEACTSVYGGARTCRKRCIDNLDCDSSAGTSVCVNAAGTTGDDVAVCSFPCDALTAQGCLELEACGLFVLPSPNNGSVGVLECRPTRSGASSTDGPCAGGDETLCQPGNTCTMDVCRKICAVDGSGATPCPASTRCVPDSPTLSLANRAFGTCLAL